MHQTQFSQKIPYGGFSPIRSHIVQNIHMALHRMDFFQFLLVHNFKSEAEQYSTVVLQTKLEVWNTAMTLF